MNASVASLALGAFLSVVVLSCRWWWCFKIDAKTGEKTNKRGLVVKGEDRLVRFQVDQNKLFEGEGKGNKLKMSRY